MSPHQPAIPPANRGLHLRQCVQSPPPQSPPPTQELACLPPELWQLAIQVGMWRANSWLTHLDYLVSWGHCAKVELRDDGWSLVRLRPEQRQHRGRHKLRIPSVIRRDLERATEDERTALWLMPENFKVPARTETLLELHTRWQRSENERHRLEESLLLLLISSRLDLLPDEPISIFALGQLHVGPVSSGPMGDAPSELQRLRMDIRSLSLDRPTMSRHDLVVSRAGFQRGPGLY